MKSNSKDIIEKADFSKMDGLLPAVIQDFHTGKVLMLGYMNKKSVKLTFKSGKVTFYSRSKKELWEKGTTSGNYLVFQSMKLDCDNDALLIQAVPKGPTCHKGTDTCWGEKNNESFSYLYELEHIIEDRKKNPVPESYTNKLLARGVNKIAQKIGEEAVEVVIEAKDDNKSLLKAEYSDLMYHLSVMLVQKGLSWRDVFKTLKGRRK